MKKELFEELTSSIKEAGKIQRGEAKPSRVFTCKEATMTKEQYYPKVGHEFTAVIKRSGAQASGGVMLCTKTFPRNYVNATDSDGLKRTFTVSDFRFERVKKRDICKK